MRQNGLFNVLPGSLATVIRFPSVILRSFRMARLSRSKIRLDKSLRFTGAPIAARTIWAFLRILLLLLSSGRFLRTVSDISGVLSVA